MIAQRAVMTPELPDLVADALAQRDIVGRAVFERGHVTHTYMATASSNRAVSLMSRRGGPRRARSLSPDYQISLATTLSARC